MAQDKFTSSGSKIVVAVTPAFKLFAHHGAGHAANVRERIDVGADPLRQRFAPARLGIGVVGCPQHRDEDVGAALLTGRRVEHRHRGARPIDEQLLAGSVRLPHRRAAMSGCLRKRASA